jgi:cytochrome c553
MPFKLSCFAGPLILVLMFLVADKTAAQPIDSMAQRMTACTVCHGKEGRAAPDGFYPRIAGKPAQYLYQQLKNFQQRQRNYDVMTHMVRNLSDDYLKAMATYFAELDLPYAAPVASVASQAELSRGEQLVKHGDASLQIPACNQCHGNQMTGMLPATPGLLGLPRDYINSQIGAWKEGSRKGQAPDCMNKVAKQLNAHDLSAVSSWLAAQPVPTNGKPSPPQPVAIAARCDW